VRELTTVTSHDLILTHLFHSLPLSHNTLRSVLFMPYILNHRNCTLTISSKRGIYTLGIKQLLLLTGLGLTRFPQTRTVAQDSCLPLECTYLMMVDNSCLVYGFPSAEISLVQLDSMSLSHQMLVRCVCVCVCVCACVCACVSFTELLKHEGILAFNCTCLCSVEK